MPEKLRVDGWWGGAIPKFVHLLPRTCSAGWGKVIHVGVHIYIHVYVYTIECDSTLYVGLARAVPPTTTNFRLTFLLI